MMMMIVGRRDFDRRIVVDFAWVGIVMVLV